MKNIKQGCWGIIVFASLLVAIVAAIMIILCCPPPHDQEAPIRVPIIMYHDVKQAPVCEDDYLISTDTLECDVKAILDAGFHPISVSELIDYVYDGKALPDKPVVLTFDDGYKTMRTQVLPLLEKYKVPAAMALIGARAEAIQDGCNHADYLSWEDVRKLAKSERIDLVSHSAYLHVYRSRKGVSMLPDEDSAHYQKMLTRDIHAMNVLTDKESIPMLPVFAYPYGYVQPEGENVFRAQGFVATMTSEEHVNIISRDRACLYQLGRLNRSGHMSTAQLISWIENGKGW